VETQELVVPRSIPITFAIVFKIYFLVLLNYLEKISLLWQIDSSNSLPMGIYRQNSIL
jgi:hypothetical protein